MAYFGQHILPLADKMKSLGMRAKSENKEALALAYRQLWFQVGYRPCRRASICLFLGSSAQSMLISPFFFFLFLQLWDLLPGFCDGAPDLVATFPKMAKTLGTALSNSEEPRMQAIICSALQKCITTAANDAAALATIGRFSKNFLPLLFNACMSADTNEKQLPFLQAVEV